MDYSDRRSFPGSENDKVHELVRNLVGILREQNLESIVKSRDYMRKWFDENVHLEGVNANDAFYYGYFVGAACIHEFYDVQNNNEKSEKKREN